jgi:LPXTG-motif cell wall-anchored protein
VDATTLDKDGKVTENTVVISEGEYTSVDTTFDAVDSPKIAGYTPDQATVSEKTGVTVNDTENDVTVTYKADTQKVVYNVIDDDKNGETIEGPTNFDTGATDSALTKTQTDLESIIKGYTDQGYELVSSDPVPSNFDTDTATDQVINIHLKHHLTTTTETKEVDETIHYVYEDGSKAAEDVVDKVIFTKETVTDDVTKEVVSQTEWTAKDDDTTFDEKDSPEIEGYTPDKASIAEVTGLTETSAPVEETVTYKKNAEPAKPTPPVDTPTPPSETPAPKPIELPKGTPAEAPAQKASILPSTGEERTAVAVVGGLFVAAAGLIGLFIHLRRKKTIIQKLSKITKREEILPLFCDKNHKNFIKIK